MKRLILMGGIGAGKTTMIRSALEGALYRAGGFVTRRVSEKGVLRGFDLSSPKIWVDAAVPSGRFLDFSRGKYRDDRVFAELGAGLLRDALDAPFAVADEFGGLELLVPEFYNGLMTLFSSDVPTIGVLKTTEAIEALGREIPLGTVYWEKVEALRAMLEADPRTLLLPVSGWNDTFAVQTIQKWVQTHIRR